MVDRPRWRLVCWALLAAAGAAGVVFEAHARHVALLVAAQEYASLSPSYRLDGPANDARLIRGVLLERGFHERDIVVLADGLPDSGRPTHMNILRAFADVEARAAAGDFVYLHFAGHGSQQPEPQGRQTESDGFDEIFLPTDVGYWSGDIGGVENALLDDEIAAFVARLRARGAFVWAVFDTCHAGTLATRGLARAAAEKGRGIDFKDLLPTEGDSGSRAREAALAAYDAGTPGRETVGDLADQVSGRSAREGNVAGYVAFYASQTWETTPELPLPREGEPRAIHGLFSYTLARALETHPQASYQELADLVLLRYDALNRSGPTPLFEGTGLSAPVFGSASPTSDEQWKLTVDDSGSGVVAAGRLQELGPDSLFAVVPSAAAADGEILGYLRVVGVELASARIEPIGYASLKAPSLVDLPITSYARLVSRVVPMRARVARPASADGARASAAVGALVMIASEDSDLLELVPTGEAADLRLVITDDRLWFVAPWATLCRNPAPGDPSCARASQVTPSLDLTLAAEPLRDELARHLHAVARGTNLLRLAMHHFTPGGSVGLEIADRAGSIRPALRNGDELHVAIVNRSITPFDVTVLFLDSRWGIQRVFPFSAGETNRIGPRGRIIIDGEVDSTETSGLERMVLIGVEAGSGTAGADFSFLAQDRLPASRSLRIENDVYDALARAGFTGGSTRTLSRSAPRKVVMDVVSWATE